jgi:hypothetical protein
MSAYHQSLGTQVDSLIGVRDDTVQRARSVLQGWPNAPPIIPVKLSLPSHA